MNKEYVQAYNVSELITLLNSTVFEMYTNRIADGSIHTTDGVLKELRNCIYKADILSTELVKRLEVEWLAQSVESLLTISDVQRQNIIHIDYG